MDPLFTFKVTILPNCFYQIFFGWFWFQWHDKEVASWKITCIEIKGEREVGSLDSSALKKSTKKRSSDQIQNLETFFQANNFITGERRLELAQLTNLSADQVSIWFQNQRRKKKREQKKDGADQQIVKHHRNEVSVLVLISQYVYCKV